MRRLPTLLPIPLLLLLAGCGGGGSPTAPAPAAPVVASAAVFIGAQDVSGATLVPNDGMTGTTRFEARLAMPMSGGMPPEMWLRYERPAGMGMMGSQGTVRMYDDGTHGDRMAGDGVYCYDDDRSGAQEIGCHGDDAPMGTYHYEFFATAAAGESNHVRVTVTVAAS